MGVRLGNGVVHQLKTCVAAHKNLFRPASQNVCKEPPGRGDSGHLAVIPHINAVGHIILRLLHQLENIADQIQLFLTGLAAGHVQRKPLGLQRLEFLLQAGVFLPAFLCRQFSVCLHIIILS